MSRFRLTLLAVALSAPIALPRAGHTHDTARASSSASTRASPTPTPSPVYGGIAWRVATGGAVRATPVIAAGMVVVGSGDGTVRAIALRTGVERWRRAVGGAIASRAAIAGDLVLLTTARDELVALELASGRVRWRARFGAPHPLPWGFEGFDYYTSSPVVAGQVVVVGGGDGTVRAFSLRDGRERWMARTGGRVRGAPAVADGRVIVGSFDGWVYAFALHDGARRWRTPLAGSALESARFGYDRRSIQGAAVIRDSVVYVGGRDGHRYALSLASGEILWSARHDDDSWAIAAAAVTDSNVIDASSDARFIRALRRDRGEERWRVTTASTVWTTPLVVDGVVYSAEGNYDGTGWGMVRALDERTGSQRWSVTLPAPILSSPALSEDRLVVGCDDGAIYALRLDRAPSPLRRAVFWDSSAVPLAHARDHVRVRDFFVAQGYERLDARALDSWLASVESDGAPRVVVFALDVAPARLLEEPITESRLHRFLTRGGRVVWTGLPPAFWPVDSSGRRSPSALGTGNTSALLGIPSLRLGLYDTYAASPTSLGTRLGLSGRWLARLSIARTPYVRTLAVDEQGAAAAWLREIGRGHFIAMARARWDETALHQLRMLAEIRVPP